MPYWIVTHARSLPADERCDPPRPAREVIVYRDLTSPLHVVVVSIKGDPTKGNRFPTARHGAEERTVRIQIRDDHPTAGVDDILFVREDSVMSFKDLAAATLYLNDLGIYLDPKTTPPTPNGVQTRDRLAKMTALIREKG